MFAWVWKLVIAFMVWLSADSRDIATEPARAAAAVAGARAVLAVENARRDGEKVVEKKGEEGVAKTQPCLTGTCPPRAR